MMSTAHPHSMVLESARGVYAAILDFPVSHVAVFTPLIFVLYVSSAYAGESANSEPHTVFGYALVVLVAICIFIAFATIRSSLMSSAWSLSDALSEEADISPLDASGKPLLGSDGKPFTVSELRASTSRFIALIGLIGILMLYLGFGLVILQNYASAGLLPQQQDMQNVVLLLFSGVTMFAPYIINKFASVFDWLKPPK